MSNLIIGLKDSQLLMNSSVINDYPSLKELLLKKDKIYQNDLLNLDTELQNLLKYSIFSIISLAANEWTAKKIGNDLYFKDLQLQRRPCSLCHSLTRYMYFIINKNNGQQLNVGSECIKSYDINTGVNKESKNQYINNQIKQRKQIQKLFEFDNKYPEIRQYINSWYEDFRNVPIMLNFQLYNEFNNINQRAGDILNQVKEGISLLRIHNNLKKVLADYKIYKIREQRYINKNKNNPLVPKRKVKIWLEKNKPDLFNQILNNNGQVDKSTFTRINYPQFLNNFKTTFNKHLKKYNLRIISIDKTITFEYIINNDKYLLQTSTNLTCSELSFLVNAIFNDSSFEINMNNFFYRCNLDNENKIKIIDNIDYLLNPYKISIDTYFIDYDEIVIKLYEYSEFIIVSLNAFVEHNKNIILLNNKNLISQLAHQLKKDTINHYPIAELKNYKKEREKSAFAQSKTAI